MAEQQANSSSEPAEDFQDSVNQLKEAIEADDINATMELIKNGALHKAVHVEGEKEELFDSILGYLTTQNRLTDAMKARWQTMTVLEVACQMGDTKIVEKIYDHDMAFLTDSDALSITTKSEVFLLFKHKVPNFLETPDERGQTLAHFMAQSIGDEEQLLVNARILIEDETQIATEGVTPVMLAIQNNLLQLLKYFLSKNPDLAQRGSPPPIWLCAVTGNLEAARLLLERLPAESVNAKGPDTSTPLLVAMVRKDNAMASLLKEKLPSEEVERVEGYFVLVPRENQAELTFLQKLSKLIPVFNEDVCLSWNPGDEETDVLSNLLEVCGLANAECHNVKDIVVYLESCHGAHANEMSNKTCSLVSDLLRMAARLEDHIATKSPLRKLKPVMVLIGSLAEGTRIGIGNEIDVTICFEVLRPEYFLRGSSAFEVRLSAAGQACFNEVELSGLVCGDILDLNQLNKSLLDAFVVALDEVPCPPRLKIGMKNRDFQNLSCEKCERVSGQMFDSTQCRAHSHCEDHLPGVTMTKLGPCLLFQWRPNDGSDLINCSIDMIPVYPHSASTPDLFKQTVKTLLAERPEGWAKTMKGYLDRDRIVGETSPGDETSFALKVQNYGPPPNFLVRAGQTLKKEVFNNEALRRIYIHLKGMKTLLKISALKSYFIKKVLLKSEYQAYAKKHPTELQLFYKAICQPELRPYFEDKLDFAQMRQDILERKTEIQSYRKL